MLYIKEFIISTISAFGFSYVFNSPRKSVLVSGLNAGFGWVIFKFVQQFSESVYIASFMSALFIAISSEVLARIFHYPASIFIFPGIINLCPGEAIYNTMRYFIANETPMAIISLYKALGIAAAIAFGVLLSSSFSLSLRTYKERSHRRTDFLSILLGRKK